MFSVFVFLFNLLVFPLSISGRFGDPVTDKISDVLFRSMGRAYVQHFGVVDSNADLTVVLEDTIGVNEFWVVDFQPYNKDASRLPVSLDNGNIQPDNTGDCSNVILDGPFSSFFGVGYYFTDQGNFRVINVSLTGPGGNGDTVHKRLFQNYMRGNAYSHTDRYGDLESRVDYFLKFQDDFGYFFNCTDTDGEAIWRYSNTTDSVEYRTTMYLTNVRPRDDNDGSKGVSWVTSNVDLVYRIYRVAIVNFVISSSALVEPTLNYVIIKPYPPDVLEPQPAKAWIKMEFETLIETPGGELLSYMNQSLNYTSRDDVASLNVVLEESDSSIGREGCDVISGRCRQTWTFYMVLDLTGPLPVDDLPIDATGTFSFQFEKHACTDSTADNPVTGCTVIPDIDFTISLIVTIQTVVSLEDATTDEPTIVLKTLKGSNGEDLRGGALEGRRGVNHQEAVTMIVGYEPELLHEDFDLLLTLFMVCKEDQTNLPGGCLDVSSANRYISYYHDDFKYIHIPDEGEETTYDVADISGEWNNSADADPNSQQTLTKNDFNRTSYEYTIGFINTALSQSRLTYTITTVYKIVDTTGRRRRSLSDSDGQILVNTALVPYGDSHTRKRRDLMEAVTYPQGHVVSLDFVGCPPRSIFNPSTLNCDCPRGETYNTKTFQCEKPEPAPPITKGPDVKPKDVLIDKVAGETNDDSSSATPIQICFILHFAILFLMYYYIC